MGTPPCSLMSTDFPFSEHFFFLVFARKLRFSHSNPSRNDLSHGQGGAGLLHVTLLMWDPQPILPVYYCQKTRLSLETKTKKTYRVVVYLSRALWRQGEKYVRFIRTLLQTKVEPMVLYWIKILWSNYTNDPRKTKKSVSENVLTTLYSWLCPYTFM